MHDRNFVYEPWFKESKKSVSKTVIHEKHNASVSYFLLKWSLKMENNCEG